MSTPTAEQAAAIRATADILMSQRIDSAPVIQNLFASNPGDWPEDFAHENGCYRCTCAHCGAAFTGYKRRVTCRVCADWSEAETIRRDVLLRAAGLEPDDWALMPRAEWQKALSEVGRLVTEASVERNLRRQLAEALTRITTAAAKSPPVAGLHYALKDGREIALESEQLDAEIAAREAARQKRAREGALDQLTAEGQKLGLYTTPAP